MSDNWHRQIAPDCCRLLQIAHVMVQVENGGKLQWNLVDSCDLPYSARVVELTNYDFPSPGWKIAIGSLSASALVAFKISIQALPVFP